MDIWTLEGEPAFANLLGLALGERSLAKCLAVVVLDLTQPWTLADTLNKWIKVLENHMVALSVEREKDSLGIPLLVVVNKVPMLSLQEQ